MSTSMRGWSSLVAVGSMVWSPLQAHAYGPFGLEDFQTRAAFELVVTDSQPLQPGASKIVTQSAFVTLAHGLVPGNSDGLEIQFFSKPISEAVKADILDNDAQETRKADYATLLLYLGKDGKIWQANMSYVVPGTSVARTVASMPDELQKYFSRFRYDGKRLVLRSQGTYVESEGGREKLRLSWNVDLDLPVIREVQR